MSATGSLAEEGEAEARQDSLTFIHGYHVWIPGWVFYDSENWLALTCTDRDCELVPAVLRPTPASWRDHYDDVATAGQRLKFQRSSDAPGEVVAWIQRDDSLSWLTTGHVDSYYAYGVSTLVQADEETYEIVISISDAVEESIGPVQLRDSLHDEEGWETHSSNHVYLRIRSSDEQQLLSEEMPACSDELNLDYLRWSGDLDRDGETDYLIDYSDGSTGTVTFYLSSYAAVDQLVGVAGIGRTHPPDGDCW